MSFVFVSMKIKEAYPLLCRLSMLLHQFCVFLSVSPPHYLTGKVKGPIAPDKGVYLHDIFSYFSTKPYIVGTH